MAKEKKKFRQRKRDWPQTVYKVWARPTAPIPDQLWKQAREMDELWNQLVRLRGAAFDNAAKTEGKAEKKAVWDQFNVDAKRLVSDSTINWECKAAVYDKFIVAMREAIKQKAILRERFGMRKVMIPHRYTGGGASVNKVLTDSTRSTRLRVRPVANGAYLDSRRQSIRRRLTRGIFGLENEAQIEFETIVHRQIPPSAIVKKAAWCGTFDRNLPPERRWDWSLQLTCEIPPDEFYENLSDHRGVCAVDLGWRIMAEGKYLRVGMIADYSGRIFELRLPLSMARSRDRDKKNYYQTFYDLIELDSQIGLNTEKAKTELAKVLSPLPLGFAKMRQRGMSELLQNADDGPVKNILDDWRAVDVKLRGIRASVQNRMVRRKSWLYRNIASWLAKTYSRIVIEDGFDLKEVAMIGANDPKSINAGKYRQFAGVGELRLAIKNAARRTRTEVGLIPAEYTTLACSVCGEISEADKMKLMMACPSGHVWDQDVNAAMNLLEAQTRAGQPGRWGENNNSLVIPEILKSSVVGYYVN